MSLQDRLTWVELLRNVVNGESIWEPVLSHHDLDDAKLDALLALAVDFSTPRHSNPGDDPVSTGLVDSE